MVGRRPPSQIRKLAPSIRSATAAIRPPDAPVTPNPAHVHAEQGRSEPIGLPRNNELRGEIARIRQEQRRTFDALRNVIEAFGACELVPDEASIVVLNAVDRAAQLLADLDPRTKRRS